MNILIENVCFYPIIGGIETHMLKISKEFIKMGHNVTVLCSNHLNKCKEKEIYKGIKIIRYPCPMLPRGLIWAWPIWHNKVIKDAIKKLPKDFDIILTMGYNFLVPNKFFFKDEKSIFIAPSTLKYYLKATHKKLSLREKIRYFFQGIITRNLERRGIKNIRVVTLSKNVKNQIMKIYEKGDKEVKIIPPGINLKKFKDNTKKRKKNIITLSRLTVEKNIDTIIKCMEKIKGELQLVGGTRKIAEKLRKITKKMKVDKKVVFIGWSKNPEKILEKSSVFVFPSLYEGFGLVLLEAMTCGLPCIAFKPDGKKIITASDEIIKNGKTGFLVKDKEEMIEKINLLLTNEKLRDKMGKEARKESKKYSWEKHAQELLKFARDN